MSSIDEYPGNHISFPPPDVFQHFVGMNKQHILPFVVVLLPPVLIELWPTSVTAKIWMLSLVALALYLGSLLSSILHLFSKFVYDRNLMNGRPSGCLGLPCAFNIFYKLNHGCGNRFYELWCATIENPESFITPATIPDYCNVETNLRIRTKHRVVNNSSTKIHFSTKTAVQNTETINAIPILFSASNPDLGSYEMHDENNADVHDLHMSPIEAKRNLGCSMERNATHIRKSKASGPSLRKTCMVCTETRDILGHVLPCGHDSEFCSECVIRHVSDIVRSTQRTHVNCLHHGCTQVYSGEDIRKYDGGAALATEMEMIQSRQVIKQMPNFQWCSRDGCPSGQLHDDFNGTFMIMTCITCGALTCTHHQTPWHTGMTCRQYDRKLRWIRMRGKIRKMMSRMCFSNTNRKVDFEKVMKKMRIKRCPKCGQGVQKIGGCDHVSC